MREITFKQFAKDCPHRVTFFGESYCNNIYTHGENTLPCQEDICGLWYLRKSIMESVNDLSARIAGIAAHGGELYE